MKKQLLLLVVSIAMMQLASAQFIDVVGKGIINDDNPTLTIPNMETVDKVVVEAAAQFIDADTELVFKVPANVTFSSGATVIQAEFQNVDENKSPAIYNDPLPGYYKLWPTNGLVMSLGYYTATFNKADISGGEISLDKNGQGKSILTFYAYIYRTDGTVNKYSLISEKRAFLFWNGIENPMEYEFDLPVAQAERNIKVSIPFSDNFETGVDSRIAVLYLVQGEQVLPSETFNLNAEGTNFLAKTIELGNVPGDVTKIIVAVYSPKRVEGDLSKTGDSFILGMPVLTVENLDPGCTHTIGYWKTHSKYGPAKPADATWDLILPTGPDTPFFLSGKTYIQVLNTAPMGNPYYILAHQYIAAELNFLAGAYDGAVDDEFDAAKALLQTYTPAQVAAMLNSSAIKKSFTTLGGILDNYNNGIIGPGHCDELQEKSAIIGDENGLVQPSEFAVYPNPVSNNAIVSFTPVNDGLATVELYNSVGQKVGRLLQQNVLKGIQVKASFNGLELNEGLYIMVLQNGNYRETAKIRIAR
jgi:hypothetical protein